MSFSRLSALVVLLIAPGVLRALAPADACSFETLTSACKIFDPALNEKIDVSDGTVIPNFSAIFKTAQERNTAAEGKRDVTTALRKSPQMQKVRQDLMSLLRDVDPRLMHPKFKFYVIDHFPQLIILLGQKSGEFSAEKIPWPPGDPKESRLVGADDFKLHFLSLFSRPELEQFQVIVRELAIAMQGIQEPTFQNSTLEEMQHITPQRQKYVQKLYEFAKLRVIELVQQGRNDSQLSNAEKNAVKKVATIHLNDPLSFEVKAHPQCANQMPNGFYNPQDHSINLCPSFYNFPDSAVLTVLAHEITHAIDPCNSQFSVFQIRRDRLKVVETGIANKVYGVRSPGNDRVLILATLERMPQGVEYTALPFPLAVSQSTLDFFMSQGVLQPVTQGVPFANYLFHDVYECLKSSRGGGFHGFDDASIRRLASDVTAVRTQYRGGDYNPEKDKEIILHAFSKYPECLGIDKHGQMGEAVADWVAAHVVGEFLAGMHLEQPWERLGPIAFFGNFVCLQRFATKEEDPDSVAAVLRGVYKDYAHVIDAHPGSKERIEKIFLVENNIRKALGCPKSPTAACEHHIGK